MGTFSRTKQCCMGSIPPTIVLRVGSGVAMVWHNAQSARTTVLAVCARAAGEDAPSLCTRATSHSQLGFTTSKSSPDSQDLHEVWNTTIHVMNAVVMTQKPISDRVSPVRTGKSRSAEMEH